MTQVVTAFRAGLDSGAGAWANPVRLPGRARASPAALRRNGGPLGLARLLLSPYGRLLRERFDSDLVRGPVSASPPTPRPRRTSRAARCSPCGRPSTTRSGSGTPSAARKG